MSTSRSRPVSIVRQGSSERGNRLSKAMSPQRTGSPSNPNRRVAKLNLYLQRARQGSSDHLHPIASEIKPNSPRNTDIKRWDGNRRVTIKWDSMRRVSSLSYAVIQQLREINDNVQDPELWFSSGDCLIHFYERGQSRREPPCECRLRTSNPAIAAFFWIAISLIHCPTRPHRPQTPTDKLTLPRTSMIPLQMRSTKCTFLLLMILAGKRHFDIISQPEISLPGCSRDP